MPPLTKPVFALAGSVGWVVAARFVDRVGKGIRGAPRDALVAEISPPGLRGASFGLRQSLDTVGAFVGPLLAIVLMWAFAGDFIAVFWVAVIPAVLSVAVLLLAVREPDRPADLRKVANPLSRAGLRRLPRAYWLTVAFAFAFTLARFSRGLPDPARRLARPVGGAGAGGPRGAEPCLCALGLSGGGAVGPDGPGVGPSGVGLVVLIAADLVLALSAGLSGFFAGVALWGLHMGLTQGILATLVADTAPAELRGTAFGLFNLVTGLALLLASALAGLLWDLVGPEATFLAGAAISAATAAGLLALRRGQGPARPQKNRG